MHPYSTSSRDRITVPLFLATASIALAFALNRLLTYLSVVPPWWFDAPSTMTFYGLLHTGFDLYLWRRLSKIRIIPLDPNIAGSWKGHYFTSHDDFSEEHECRLDIQQTWRSIIIRFSAEGSRSRSLSASLSSQASFSPTLVYEYISEPLPGSSDGMAMHRGTARLTIEDSATHLEGTYYTDRGRITQGRIFVTKQQPQ